MSDRVGYPVGNTLGRDHIQFPTISLADLATLGYTRTTGIDLAAIMVLAWRVKKWSVSSSGATVTGQAVFMGGPETEIVTSSFPIPTFDLDYGLVTREQGLVGAYTVSENGFIGLGNEGLGGGVNEDVTEHAIYDNNDDPPEHEEGDFEQNLTINASLFSTNGDQQLVGFDSNLFYPKLQIGGLLNGQFSNAGIGLVAAGSNGTLTVVPGIVPSFTFPLKISMTLIKGQHGNLPATTTGGSIAMTMTATEFWPYKNSQNAPVYDSSSGAELVSPFS